METVGDHKCGIILVMFGTSVESGLAGLLNIRDRFLSRFPGVPVYYTFTSKIIRNIWQQRNADPDYREEHCEVPAEIYGVMSPADCISACAKEGMQTIVIQPVQIAPAICELTAEDYIGDVESSVLKRFRKIRVGRPAFGTFGCRHPYGEDVIAVAEALSQDIDLARQEKAALCYLGHGNRFPDTGRVYDELVAEMRRQYPDIPTCMAMVEDGKSFGQVVEELKSLKVTRVLLKPFMIVAGDHVRKEMLGKGNQALQTLLEQQGIDVLPVVKGLGEIDTFADIFIRHAVDAAADAGIELG